ncbi:MAG: hypothetical protein JO133_04770 [Burkholderiaceae bacterium]|nr:hypothetical protein [Burkholderiaceae bacterium]MBV8421583.1 hypothetical protein [Hyphomicrobiales bacterium]
MSTFEKPSRKVNCCLNMMYDASCGCAASEAPDMLGNGEAYLPQHATEPVQQGERHSFEHLEIAPIVPSIVPIEP